MFLHDCSVLLNQSINQVKIKHFDKKRHFKVQNYSYVRNDSLLKMKVTSHYKRSFNQHALFGAIIDLL